MGSDVILSANSNVCEGRDGEGGEEWVISPSKSKTKLCLCIHCTNPHMSVPRKILAGFLFQCLFVDVVNITKPFNI